MMIMIEQGNSIRMSWVIIVYDDFYYENNKEQCLLEILCFQ